MVSVIKYKKLILTVKYFERIGYKYIEVPWLVSLKAIRSTFSGDISPSIQNKYPIGSGEQGFVELDLRGELPPGRYITITPCFRNEPEVNDRTQLHFVKAELYDSTSYGSKYKLAGEAIVNFSTLAKSGALTSVETPEGLDINLNEIEIGSYGEREYEGLRWAYGTAIALPRFDYAKIL